MRTLRAILAVTSLLTVCGGVARADLSCTLNPVTTTILRSEGVTELLPDVSFSCLGVPPGGSAGFNFTVFVNAPITSKTDGSVNTEAAFHWSGTATGSAVGVVTGNTTLNFLNVTFAPSAPAPGFTLTLSGIRVNVSTMAQSAGIANGVSVQIIATPVGTATPLFGGTSLVSSVQNLAYAIPSLNVQTRVTGAGGTGLVPGTLSLAQCDVRAWSADSPGPASFYVTFQEIFSNGFRPQAQEAANPAIPTNGTRLMVTFGNIPDNVQLYVPNRVVSEGTSPTAAASLVTGASATGSGGVLTATDGYTQVALTAASGGTVVYEITAASGPLTEIIDVPVWVGYASGQLAALTSVASPVSVAGSYAPVSTAPGASAGPIPRFTMVPQLTTGVFTIAPCQTSLLFPYIQTAAGWNTGVAVSNTGADPFGTLGQANSCTFYFYGGTPSSTNPIPTPATIPAFKTPTIPAGSTWASVASNMGAVTFQGYAIAQCDFRYAHGYAFVAGAISTSFVAQSYLALVLDGGSMPVTPRNRNPGERLTN